MSKPLLPLALPTAPAAMQHRIEHNGLLWLDFAYPGVEQVAFLRDTFGFHPLHLEDILSRVQRPKIEDEPDRGYLFIVLHFPVFNEMTRLSTLSEVDLFVGPNYVVTLHDGKLRPLRRMIDAAEGRGRAQFMGGGAGFLLYKIISSLIESCFPMLYRLDETLDRIETDIFTLDVIATVQELSYIRRDLISLRRIMRPNMPVVRSLAPRAEQLPGLGDEAYIGDLIDGLVKIWDMLEEQKEIIDGLDATLGSLTSHRINREMKTFTLISVTMLPLTLLASILGMNVVIPFAENPWALLMVLLTMGGLAAGMISFFRYKRWL
jgi:magnesium transporter